MFAGGITSGMQNTGHTVSCLSGEGNLSVNSVKGHPEIDKVGNARWGFGDQYPHCLLITQTDSGSYRVLEMQLWRVVLTYSGGNTTLCIFGIAVINTALGYNEYTTLLLSQQSSIEPGYTTTNYYVVILILWTSMIYL